MEVPVCPCVRDGDGGGGEEFTSSLSFSTAKVPAHACLFLPAPVPVPGKAQMQASKCLFFLFLHVCLPCLSQRGRARQNKERRKERAVAAVSKQEWMEVDGGQVRLLRVRDLRECELEGEGSCCRGE